MNQLALDLRNDGMRRASQAQGTEWARRAYAAIVSVAVENPTVHVDDVLARFGEAPHHPNAWGAVWMRAIRERVIARTGTVRQCKDTKKHAHQYPVYQSLVMV